MQAVDPDYSRATILLNEALKEILRLMNNESIFEKVKEKDGIIVSRMPRDNGPILMKNYVVINKPIEQISSFIWNFNNKKITDPVLKDVRVLKSFENQFRIMHEELSLPWPISNRDFVYAEKLLVRDDGILIFKKSIEGVLPEVKNVIRADTIVSGTYLKRISDNVTEYVGVGCVDIKGSIPTIAKSIMAGKQIDRLNTLIKALG